MPRITLISQFVVGGNDDLCRAGNRSEVLHAPRVGFYDRHRYGSETVGCQKNSIVAREFSALQFLPAAPQRRKELRRLRRAQTESSGFRPCAPAAGRRYAAAQLPSKARTSRSQLWIGRSRAAKPGEKLRGERK
jgi:hypothetical protein